MAKTNLKRALALSMAAMMLCVAMLAGTTFAWFTDTASSTGNRIQAGNLDIDLLMSKNGSYTSIANGTGDIFASAATANNSTVTLWEPGKTQIAYLAVENDGSLALKYELDFYATNDAKNTVNAVNAFEYAIIVGANASNNLLSTVTNWEELKASATYSGELSDIATTFGKLVPSDLAQNNSLNNTDYLAFCVHMKEEADNKYEMQSIIVDVKLIATQFTEEKDSFGNEYDKDAVWADYHVTSAEGFAAAIDDAVTNGGGTIALMNDIEITTGRNRAAANGFAFAIPAGANVVINLNGNNIKKVSATSDINGDGKFTSADNQGIFQVKGNLSVVGEGTITMQNTGDDMEWNALSAAFSVEGGNLTLGEGVTVIHMGGTAMAYCVDVNTTLGATTLTVDGAVLSSTYTAIRLFNFHATNLATVNVNSGIVDGAKRDIWRQSTGASSINIADGIAYSEADGIYTFNSATADNAGALDAALNSGKDVALTGNMYFSGKDTAANSGYKGQTGVSVKGGAVLDGNGYTLGISDWETWSSAVHTTGGTIKNLTINSGMRGIFMSGATEDVYIDNVIIDGTIYTFNSDDGNKNYGVYISNSTLNGWTSFSNVHKEVIFTNCNFGEGQGYAFCRPYNAAEFIGCTFEAGFEIEAIGAIVLDGCYYGETLITAENIGSLGLIIGGADKVTVK